MKFTDPTAGRPRRELVESRLLTAYGFEWLEVTVEVQSHVLKSGEVRYRLLTSRYLVRRVADGVVELVTDRQDEAGVPVVWTVNRWGCDCPDAGFRGRLCKHFCSVMEQGLLGKAVAESEGVA